MTTRYTKYEREVIVLEEKPTTESGGLITRNKITITAIIGIVR
jgi:hypothetical protein